MNLTRHEARNVGRFTQAVTVAVAKAPDRELEPGDVYFAFVVEIDGKLQGAVYGCSPKEAGEKAIVDGITRFYESLRQEGVIAA